jgi:Flp pilus assembly protein TadG
MSFHLKKLSSLGFDTEGVTAVEFALISPVLLLLLMGGIEGGRMLWAENSLQYAVERAARCAVVTPSVCGTAAQVQTYAASVDYGQNVSASAFSLTTASCGTLVSASLSYTPLFPIVTNVTLTASSCRPSS